MSSVRVFLDIISVGPAAVTMCARGVVKTALAEDMATFGKPVLNISNRIFSEAFVAVE
ncbi:hypothetical protein BGZ51_001248 [Haplosporangium sp. Z 767]|nr:hypothetical protein BGZ51_001248 [Haplosporangium sp. Z 767]